MTQIRVITRKVSVSSYLEGEPTLTKRLWTWKTKEQVLGGLANQAKEGSPLIKKFNLVRLVTQVIR
jgi:hypothetical protein